MDFSIGDAVFGVYHSDMSSIQNPWNLSSTPADYSIVVPLRILCRKPPGFTFDEVATIPIAGCAAYQSFYECGNLQNRQQILIFRGDTLLGPMMMEMAKKSNSGRLELNVIKYRHYKKHNGFFSPFAV